MEVLTRTNGREMTLAISGELDHHGAHGAMQQIDHALDAALPLSLTMDLSGVSFMDSSGIAVVIPFLFACSVFFSLALFPLDIVKCCYHIKGRTA